MRPSTIIISLLIFCSSAYATLYNDTLLWSQNFDEDGSPDSQNDITDFIDNTGEMGAGGCDFSVIQAARGANPVTCSMGGWEFYATAATAAALEIWELNNTINGSQLDGVCSGVYCSALNNNLTQHIITWTGSGVDNSWMFVGHNETAMAQWYEDTINSGAMNGSIIKNSTDSGGADYESTRGRDYTADPTKWPRCVYDCIIVTSTVTKTLYVDPESLGGACSDAYTRAEVNITHPWCSLQEALDNRISGDFTYLRGGNHSNFIDTAGSAQVGGFEYTTSTTWDNTTTIAGYPGEDAILTSHIDMSSLGTWTESGGIWTVAYEGYNEYMRYFLRNGTTGQKWEILAYDDDEGDMDSYADMADSTNPYGCYCSETTDDYIECRFPSWVNPNTAGMGYISNSTAVLFFDNQDGVAGVLTNFTVESARVGIYTTDGANLIIENVDIWGGEFGIRQARFINLTVKKSYLLQDYYDDSTMAWDEHRKSESAETSGIFTDDDPTGTNITQNRFNGWFNGILAYNNDGDSGVNGLYTGLNNFSNIFDDCIEVEGDGYTSRHYGNRFNDSFVGFSFHPYDDPTHSTTVDHNLYYNPKYNYFYKGGASYYGEAVKMASTSDYTEGVNFQHNNFVNGNGIKANSGQTHTQYYCNWTDNIFYGNISGTRLIDKTGLEADNVFYDHNLYYSSGVYFRYFGSDSISTEYSSLAAADATGRMPLSNANSIDAHPNWNDEFIPYADSPVCGAGSGGSDIGAYACASGNSSFSVHITQPANNTITVEADGDQDMSFYTTATADCMFTYYTNMAPNYPAGGYQYWWYSTDINKTYNSTLNSDYYFQYHPSVYALYYWVECTAAGVTKTSGNYTLWLDQDDPVATITAPPEPSDSGICAYDIETGCNFMQINKTAGDEWVNVNASCYDQNLYAANVYIIEAEGSTWYWSQNNTALNATATTYYEINENVSLVGWPAQSYIMWVDCIEIPAFNTESIYSGIHYLRNITIQVNDTETGTLLENFTASATGTFYTNTYTSSGLAVGPNATLWVRNFSSMAYTFSANISGYEIQNHTVYINASDNNQVIILNATGTGAIVYVYDETTETLINTTTITFDFVTLLDGVYNTSTGIYNFQGANIEPGYYEVRYSASGYSDRTRTIYISDTELINYTFYLLNSSLSDYSVIRVIDEDSKPVEDIRVAIYREFPPSYNLINEVYTNFEGETTSDFIRNTVYYRFYLYTGDTLLYVSNNTLIFKDTLNIQVPLTEDQLQSLKYIVETSHNISLSNDTCTFKWAGNGIKAAKVVLQQVSLSSTAVTIDQNQTNTTYGTLILHYTASPNVRYICKGWLDTNTSSSWFVGDQDEYINQSSIAVFGLVGLFIAFIIVVAFSLSKTDHPIALIVMALVALVFSSLIGFINIGYGYLIMICAIGGFLIFRMRA